MRIAGALFYAMFVAAAFGSAADHSSPLWALLAWLVVVLFVAGLLRVHAVVNAPKHTDG